MNLSGFELEAQLAASLARALRRPLHFFSPSFCPPVALTERTEPTEVRMRSQAVVFAVIDQLLETILTRRGSRLGNSGNVLELQVLTQLHHVP